MIFGIECKALAASVKQYAEIIGNRIADAFENSIVESSREVDFLDKLIRNLNDQLSTLDLPNFRISCRYGKVHQKPIVSTHHFRCELGDLLVVVKYRPYSNQPQANCVIYQVKMAKKGTTTCEIDEKQLTLLTRWPEFTFGRKRDTALRTFKLEPRSLSFGSYLLVPRNIERGQTLTPWEDDIPLDFGTASIYWTRSYGLGPTAWEVYARRENSIQLTKESTMQPDVHSVLNQVLFLKGENLRSRNVKRLVSTLYRYVGLSPDPPKEFDRFSEIVTDDGFAALEITLEERAGPYRSSEEATKREPMHSPVRSCEQTRLWK